MNTILIPRIVLVLFALTLNGCIISQFYRDSQFHRDRQFYRNYRPPTEINGREFSSSVTGQPDRIQLVNGEGYEYRLRDEGHKLAINYASYFVPGDTSPFAAPARVSSIEYLYCMLGDAPRLCGGKIVYESEEVYEDEVLSKIRQTNHELIVDELITKHGRPQYREGYTQVIAEDAYGAVYRSSINRDQKRIWCDFSRGVPKKCRRSIIAMFSPAIGRGSIIYIDERMYDYLRWFEAKLKHRNPAMDIIRGERRYGAALSPEEQAWWVGRLSKSSPHAFIPWEKLHTEIQLDAKAKASGKPRAKIARKMTQEEFQREWVTAWVNFESGSTAERAYWYGYLEAILARNFDHQFQLTDEAHKKWTVTSRESPTTATFAGDGYIHGLAGIRRPGMASQAIKTTRREYLIAAKTGA